MDEVKSKVKKLDRIAYVLSAVVLALVVLMRGDYKPDLGFDTTFIPALVAGINSAVTICLLAALLAIKSKNVKLHRNLVNAAMLLSACFLLFYVLYHFTNYETPFCKEGIIRKVYFFFLITHIILAGISLPFILMTYIRGYVGDLSGHRRMAKWVYPIWLYVAATGPLVYFMLRPCYPF